MNGLAQIKDRIILHADVNNFFASVECSLNPQLMDKPVAVTGNPLKRTGIILAKNELAKKQGVKTGQVIGEAKALCPNLICLPPHHELYEEISLQLQNLYLSYSNFVEPLGLDECWIDVTHSSKYLGKTGKEIADELRQKIKDKFGFTISVGVSFSKLFAKLASDLRKPDFTTEIPYENYKNITYPMPLNSIVGIGSRLSKRFFSIGIETIGDFVKLDDDYLNQVMGINGINLKNDLLGIREERVLDYYMLPPPKSIGNGTTTNKDIVWRKDIEKVVNFLAQKISSRMIKHKVIGSTIYVKLKANDLSTARKSMKIPPTNTIKDIANHAMSICDKIYKYNKPLRAIRIKMSSLSSSMIRQMSMFDPPKNDYSQVMEQINNKYGRIFLASDKSAFINSSTFSHEE